jgi:diadenosine tetraphosphate (Ap4A) HIT family hydrolase
MAVENHAIAAALRGANPMVMARVRSGFAVIGDTQHLPGYSLLLTDDLSADHPTDLPWRRRRQFFLDLSLLGEAVLAAGRERGVHRINYEVLGNSWNHLHGHVHTRYEWEAPDKIVGPVWRYPKEVRDAPEHAYDDSKHGELRAAVTVELERLMREAYAELDP